jgi:hypothetical protein
MVPVVLAGSAAGAKAGNADTTETVALVVPIWGKAELVVWREVLVISAAAKNCKNLAAVRKTMKTYEKL